MRTLFVKTTWRAAMRTTLTTTALICLAGSSLAHGPLPQKVVETVTIDRSPDAVWKQVKDFGDMRWHPAVEATTADRGNEPGSVRTVSLKGGGSLMETLERYSDPDRSYSYQLSSEGPLPVSNYRSTLTIHPLDGGRSKVEWGGTFMRADRSSKPAADRDDQAAVQTVTGVYRAGLGALKRMVESN